MRIVGYRHDPLVPKESGPIKSLETAEPSGHEGDGTPIGRSKPRRAKADGQIGTEKRAIARTVSAHSSVRSLVS
jgi:hypothetical protein